MVQDVIKLPSHSNERGSLDDFLADDRSRGGSIFDYLTYLEDATNTAAPDALYVASKAATANTTAVSSPTSLNCRLTQLEGRPPSVPTQAPPGGAAQRPSPSRRRAPNDKAAAAARAGQPRPNGTARAASQEDEPERRRRRERRREQNREAQRRYREKGRYRAFQAFVRRLAAVQPWASGP